MHPGLTTVLSTGYRHLVGQSGAGFAAASAQQPNNKTLSKVIASIIDQIIDAVSKDYCTPYSA